MTCNLGTVAMGFTLTITLVVRTTVTRLITNTGVTVVGKEPESNTANNRATATTLVVCDRFTVTPRTLRVGERTTVVVRVTTAGIPAKRRKVVMSGSGIFKTGRTNARGIARITVIARRRGIVTITAAQTLNCRGTRIAVLGAIG